MTPNKIKLSREHITAVERNRRVVIDIDTGCEMVDMAAADREKLVSNYFEHIDDKETQIDSLLWCWGAGNTPWWPSKVFDDADRNPQYNKWREKNIDFVRIFQEETKKRGLEAFLAYRINGTDGKPLEGRGQVELKKKHPEWQIDWSALKQSDMIPIDGPIAMLPHWKPPAAAEGKPNYISSWNPHQGYWNFAVPEVRDYKLSILREVAEQYDFDGIDIDFGRIPPHFPIGHQWEHREEMTDFMRKLRLMLLELEGRRGRPYLLSARIPATIVGCHFDGIDVETWAREQLLDILSLGVRSFDVDVEEFRDITAGRHIKLYPSYDGFHYSNGYGIGPGDELLRVMRGVFSNFLTQGADGILIFNFAMSPREKSVAVQSGKIEPATAWYLTELKRLYPMQRQILREAGSLETLQGKDKIFPIQRRGGPRAYKYSRTPQMRVTPRHRYTNENVLSQLPANLANDGKGDTLLNLMVGDDVNTDAKIIDQITIRVLLSDPAAEGLPDKDRLEVVAIPHDKQAFLDNIPPAKSIQDQIELRLNNILLERPGVGKGWLVFTAYPRQFAIGKNLVGMRVTKRPPDVHEEIMVEKLEMHVKYR